MKKNEVTARESCAEGSSGGRGRLAIPLTEKRLLSEKEMEALYGWSRHTWRWHRVRGSGPEYLKMGSRVFYDREVVEAWLKGRKTSSTSQPAGVKPC
ncbi:MAG: hypothetical protein JNN26_05070 [Candidatus Obscuribacter sp.]|nr:hypothetical protein [Candidatus Obscuribacter sp.]